MDDAGKEAAMASLKTAITEFYASINLSAENAIFSKGLSLYLNKADYTLAPAIVLAAKSNKNDMNAYINSLMQSSVFESESKLLNYIDNMGDKKISDDPLMALSANLINHLNTRSEELVALQTEYNRSFRLLVQGMRESGLASIQYPDANSTLRLSYGKVSALPADKRNDAKVNYYTTLQGAINKYKPNDEEFDLPKRLMELNATKDFGEYADKDGHMPVNFLTNNDITGGNSGSPVLNGKGELIGLAFDGNIEAMAGDVIFDDLLQKTINVDIRYVLFIIDKYAGARHIVDEMTIIR